ncbi:MAG: winged helix-turn-helix domain-containing protein [Lewinella sp.]
MHKALPLHILEHSPQPKYIQLAEYFKKQINSNQLNGHTHLPSINRLSARYDLSRDTVRKAYLELKRNNLVHGVRGKGYYVSPLINADRRTGTLALLERPGQDSLQWQLEIIAADPDTTEIEFQYHHGNCEVLQHLAESRAREFDRVIVCGSFAGTRPEKLLRALDACPASRTSVFLDDGTDFPVKEPGFDILWKDILYRALHDCVAALKEVSQLNLCFAETTELPKRMLPGFQRFCIDQGKRGMILLPEEELHPQPGRGYILTEPWQLARLLNQINQQGLADDPAIAVLYVGHDPALEIIGGGITSLEVDRATAMAGYLTDTGVPSSRQSITTGVLHRRRSL